MKDKVYTVYIIYCIWRVKSGPTVIELNRPVLKNFFTEGHNWSLFSCDQEKARLEDNDGTSYFRKIRTSEDKAGDEDGATTADTETPLGQIN